MVIVFKYMYAKHFDPPPTAPATPESKECGQQQGACVRASAHSRIALPFTTGFFGVIEGAHANTANAAGRTAHPDGWPPSRVEITVGSVYARSVCFFFVDEMCDIYYYIVFFFKLHYAFLYLNVRSGLLSLIKVPIEIQIQNSWYFLPIFYVVFLFGMPKSLSTLLFIVKNRFA